MHHGTVFFHELRRSARLSAGARPGAGADHRGRADATPTFASTRRGIAADRRARATTGENVDRRDSRRRARRRRGLLFGSDRQSRRQVPGVAAVEPSEHAVGRHRAVGRGVQRRRVDRRAREDRRRRRASRSSSRSGRRTARCIFVSDRTGWWNLYRWSWTCSGQRRAPSTRWRRSSASRSGRSAW